MDNAPTTMRAYMSASSGLYAFGNPSMPSGLSKGCSRTAPGEKAASSAPNRTRVAVNQATRRQRAPGNLPSGNTNSRSTINPVLGTQIQASIQAATSPPTSDPGEVTRVYMAYSPQKWITPNNNPIVQKSHPTKLLGRRLATTAPTVEYPTASAVASSQ